MAVPSHTAALPQLEEGIFVTPRTNTSASEAPPSLPENEKKPQSKELKRDDSLPVYGDGTVSRRTTQTLKEKVRDLIRPHGESGRTGIHPKTFLYVCFRSNCPMSKFVNRFWPVVPVAFALVSIHQFSHPLDPR
jgi:Ca2+:H+ antiporter